MPKISVIIPTFNRAQYIGAAIESVLAQSERDFEMIVVDDGSTDDTRQMVTRIADDRMHYHYQTNRGEAGARNTGLRLARGEYIAFLDADDTFLPNKLKLQAALLDNQPNTGIVYSDVWVCDSNNQPCGLFSNYIASMHPSGWVFESLARGNFLTVNSTLARSAAIADAGFFDETLVAFPDWDLWLRVATQAQFHYLDIPLARYRVHAGMVSQNRIKMWRGALAVRAKLMALPAFQTCAMATRQYCLYQFGLLDCLVGDLNHGRRRLWRAFHDTPSIRAAGIAWVLSFLGRRVLQAITTWRSETRGWVWRVI